MVKPIITHAAKKRLSWYGHVMRRHERWKACNNNEGGREETSRQAQTEVDGQHQLDPKLAPNREAWRNAVIDYGKK